jgi:hypothetical protein
VRRHKPAAAAPAAVRAAHGDALQPQISELDASPPQ